MAIKNQDNLLKCKDNFEKCKNCYFSEINYEIRKDTIKCSQCRLNNSYDELKEEIFKTKPFIKVLFPIVLFLNNVLEKNNNLLRRK